MIIRVLIIIFSLWLQLRLGFFSLLQQSLQRTSKLLTSIKGFFNPLFYYVIKFF
ncbi:hypothetical protein HanXRQr2_Chr13g0570031 [Helianthus annuus]|uniref:Uncharacterized protein n=1 Tax=Helianthus annuus TaxID=4232 RepID=A0A9K3EE33_HELAN|nr:hypothetical protein HanXRQr2_Chr13g0570031 [Helianthus annuus]KAJ0479513.1 hypothetical protein HanIR_Chr13g0620831 [Helianthus annuus]